MKTIRLLAICSSLGLLFSYVWFTQRQGEPTLMPSSKLKQIGVGTALYSLLPGKSPGSSSDVFIKADSKSFTSGAEESSQALGINSPPQPARP